MAKIDLLEVKTNLGSLNILLYGMHSLDILISGVVTEKHELERGRKKYSKDLDDIRELKFLPDVMAKYIKVHFDLFFFLGKILRTIEMDPVGSKTILFENYESGKYINIYIPIILALRKIKLLSMDLSKSDEKMAINSICEELTKQANALHKKENNGDAISAIYDKNKKELDYAFDNVAECFESNVNIDYIIEKLKSNVFDVVNSVGY